MQLRRRVDGRVANQIRALAAEFGVLGAADGSARLSMGDTRVLVAVYGPRPARSIRHEDPHRSTLEVVVLPASGQAGKGEADLELALHSIFDPVIVSAAHPRTVVSVHAQVMHDDGALLPALINCVSLGLVDAGVPIDGIVCGVSCGLTTGGGGGGAAVPAAVAPGSGGLALDLLPSEEAQCAVAGAYAFKGAGGGPSVGPVFVRQSGCGTWEQTRALLAEAERACHTLQAFLRLAIQRKLARDSVSFGPEVAAVR